MNVRLEKELSLRIENKIESVREISAGMLSRDLEIDKRIRDERSGRRDSVLAY